MKLYYSKGACSLSVHIVLEELGIPYEAVAVDLTKDPTAEFLKVSPLGAVPVIVMDNGQPLTEAAVILQYLADQKPSAALAPAPGTMERVRLQESLNFIATEIHKGFGPLWGAEYFTQNVQAQQDVRQYGTSELARRFDILSHKLNSQQYLLASGYSVADAYLFTVLNWTHFLKVDLSKWPSIQTYMNRVKERPATIRALKAEHLM